MDRGGYGIFPGEGAEFKIKFVFLGKKFWPPLKNAMGARAIFFLYKKITFNVIFMFLEDYFGNYKAKWWPRLSPSSELQRGAMAPPTLESAPDNEIDGYNS